MTHQITIPPGMPRRKDHMYSSAHDHEIFQRKPRFSKPSQFKAKGWTDTIEGYLYEANKLTTCILDNRKLLGRPYSWFLTIYIHQEMGPSEIASLWTQACRKFRRHGLTAIWVREATRNNKVHYHLLVSNQIAIESLAAIVEKSMPKRMDVGWHKRILPNNDRPYLAFYLTKAKIKGSSGGQHVPDVYAKKRLLFKSGQQLKKYGTIGDFWLLPKKQLWKRVQDRERRIADGLADEQVRKLAEHAHEFIEGYVPLRKIERSYGYWANEKAIQSWMERRGRKAEQE